MGGRLTHPLAPLPPLIALIGYGTFFLGGVGGWLGGLHYFGAWLHGVPGESWPSFVGCQCGSTWITGWHNYQNNCMIWCLELHFMSRLKTLVQVFVGWFQQQ